MYHAREDWNKHLLKEHHSEEYWICLACPDALRFDEKGAFVAHIQNQHSEDIAQHQIASLVAVSARRAPVNLRRCPICAWPGSEAENIEGQAVMDHVAWHVHEFSLFSLPWPGPSQNMDVDSGRTKESIDRVRKWLQLESDAIGIADPQASEPSEPHYFDSKPYFEEDDGTNTTINSTSPSNDSRGVANLENEPPLEFDDGEQLMMKYENNPAYVNQRLRLQPSFSGKSDKIEQQIRTFTSITRSYTGQNPPQRWKLDVIAENEMMQVVSNFESFDVLQYQDDPSAAGMSMIHLLAIPRLPIFNPASLSSDNADIIDDMIGFFEETWAEPVVQAKILRGQLEAINRRAEECMAESSADEISKVVLSHYRFLEERILDLDPAKDFYYGMELSPDNSVDFWVMHIIAAPYEFRKYSSSERDRTMKDAIEFRDFWKRFYANEGAEESSLSVSASISQREAT